MPANATTLPTAHKPLSERVRLKLLRLARSSSEGFARAMMAAAAALEDGASDDDARASGVEFVDSLNGIDLYEDTTIARASADQSAAAPTAATRLRSLCHIEADIADVVRRITASVAAPHLLPGVVETQELCSVLWDGVHAPPATPEKEFPERAGVNWFVLPREATRDSAGSLSQSSASTASRTRDRTSSSSARSSAVSRDSSSDDAGVEFVVLSYQGVFKHRGRRGWVQWCQSVELSSFPASATSALSRGVLFSSGIVAVESATRPGHVSMSYAMGLDLSAHDERERRFLEGAVWKRVMKLAALKKALQRESLSRTLSISSAGSLRRSSQSSQDASPTTTYKTAQKQPECEPPMFKNQQVCTERVAKTTALPPTLPSKPVDKRRQRAQTMQPTLSSSPFRDPDSLEFRLSLYSDPDEFPDFSPESPTALRRDTREPVAVRSVSTSAIKASKSGRPKSRSVGTGWAF